MKPLSDEKIIDSWKKNVDSWINALRNEEIESRVLITNRAIIEAILAESPSTILDIGCGEGWLIRHLEKNHITGLGIDVVPKFIEYANKLNPSRFKTLSYEEISSETVGQTFDVIICNFSLLGKESVEHIFAMAPQLINSGGKIIVQTIHPEEATGTQEYADGWRPGSWSGFNDTFTDPAPWYFRTIDSWKKLFRTNHFDEPKIIETRHPDSDIRLSIIFIGKKKVQEH